MSDRYIPHYFLISGVIAVLVYLVVLTIFGKTEDKSCLEWKSTERTICTGNEYQKICEPEKVCVRWRTP